MAMILVVDDIEENCESIKGLLTTEGHRVHTVQRVSDGIEQLRACREAGWVFGEPYAVAIIDLMFTNYEGPGNETAGIHVLAEALKVPFLQPIILTAYPSIETATEAYEMGAFGYVTKAKHGDRPFIGRLADTMKRALEKRESMMTHYASLSMLKGALDSFRKDGIEGARLEDALNALRLVEAAYQSLLESLGPLFRVNFVGKDRMSGSARQGREGSTR